MSRTPALRFRPPSSEAASESTSSSVEAVHYEARYQVDKNGGGTLASGNESGKTSLSYSITDASQTVSVTAVPAEGHVFVKWSDGVTSKTRRDTHFKQNVDVTAVFAAVSVEVSSEGKGLFSGLLYLPRKNQRQVRQQRYDPLVRQRRGS